MTVKIYIQIHSLYVYIFAGGPPLSISPRMGTMLGGTPVVISGPTFSEMSTILCSFDGKESLGTYISDDVAVCVTPAFESVGWISLNM